MEGGGFRGVYTAGVLDFFIDRKAMFSSVYGISAGACNALNYLSQDRGRYIEIAKRFCNFHSKKLENCRKRVDKRLTL